MVYKYKVPIQFVVCFMFFLCGGVAAFGQNVDRYKIIKKIDITGNERISAAAIKSTIVTKVGDIYSSETISKDVDAIWSLGFFNEIEVELDQFEGGIKVGFIVLERPVVRNLTFIGCNKIKAKKLKEKVDLLENDDLKLYMLKLDEDKIRDFYHEKGFLFAKVSAEQRPVRGGVEIVYHIDEGPKVRVAKIGFKGNESIEDKILLKYMKTKPKRFPKLLFGGLFEKEEFEDDIERLREYYRAKGWLDAEVGSQIDYSPDKSLMYITVVVNEEERYFVDHITINGQTIFSDNEILNSIQLVDGGPFLLELLEKDLFDLRMIYGEQGFSNVRINEEHYFDPDSTDINVDFNITENERVFIEKIKITGNDKTKDNVIRRQLEFYPGDYLNIAKVKEAQQNLMNTGYFDNESGNPVDLNFEPGSKPNTQNVLIDVKEGRSGMLRFGGGFGANVGIFGDISYTDRNFDILDLPKDLNDLLAGNAFRGAGHVFSIRVAPGLKRQEASLSVFNPAVYDSNYSAGFSLFSFSRKREDYDEKRKGAKINLGKRYNRSLFVGLTPSFEVITINDVDEDLDDTELSRADAPEDVFDVEGDHSKLGAELKASINTRDNPFLPSRGYIAETSLEVAGLDVEIVKYVLSLKKFQTVYNSAKKGKHTLTMSGTLGLVETTSGADVPIFERFFAGGSGSIRGFKFRGASPVEDNQQIGGNVLMLASLEYNFPVVKKFLRGVAFFDAGKADKDIADINLDNFRASAGFGVRISVPILGRATIALDWGFPVVQQDDDEIQRFSFNMGQGG